MGFGPFSPYLETSGGASTLMALPQLRQVMIGMAVPLGGSRRPSPRPRYEAPAGPAGPGSKSGRPAVDILCGAVPPSGLHSRTSLPGTVPGPAVGPGLTALPAPGPLPSAARAGPAA